MKDILLGQYSYLLNEDHKVENDKWSKQQVIQERIEQSYFFKELRKPLETEIRKRIKRTGFNLADTIYSEIAGSATLFFDANNPDDYNDVEITIKEDSIDPVINLVLQVKNKVISKKEIVTTGNVRRDIETLMVTIIDMFKKVI